MELDELAARIVEAGLATWAGAMGESRQLIVRGQAHLLEDLTAAVDLERVRLLFADLETKTEVIDLLERAEQGEGVRIFIGSENKLFSLSGSSMIAAPLRDSERRIIGALGVIGPTRINYARIVSDGRLYGQGRGARHRRVKRRVVSNRRTAIALREILRVDVDLDANAASLLRSGGEHVAQKGLHVGAARSFGQQAESVAAADERDGRLGGTKQRDFILLWPGAGRSDSVARRWRQFMRRAREGARMRFRRGGVLGGYDQRGETAEGRQSRALAYGDLLFVELFRVSREKRRDHRMRRVKRLDQRLARLVAAPGAPCNLIEQLKCALGGAWIAAAQAQIRVDDADKREKRKIVAFGDELRADDDIEGAFGDLLQFAPQPVGAARKIRREDEYARIWKERRRFFGEPLDARSAGRERVLGAAFRASVRPTLDMAAMMAHQRTPKTMLDEPRVAIFAAEAMAACAANR